MGAATALSVTLTTTLVALGFIAPTTLLVTAIQVPGPLLSKAPSVIIVATRPTYLVLQESHPTSPSFIFPTTTTSAGTTLLEHNNAPSNVLYNNLHHYLIAEGALDIVRNIAIGITAVLFLLAGLTYLYASLIIPAAAQELEKECKELDPALWDEYMAKLGDGETIAGRPDLMQELGAKLQPKLDAKIMAMGQNQLNQNRGGGGGNNMPTPLETTMNPFTSNRDQMEPPSIPKMGTDQWDDDNDVIDVVVEKKVTKESTKGEEEKE